MVDENEAIYGLSTQEAIRRAEKFGYNVLASKKKISPIKIFLSQFNDFMTIVLIGATVISGLMGEKADAITILIIVIMNAVLGFLQEFKTEKSLEALKSMAAPVSKVYRDGKIKVISSSLIVPGDVVVLESGDKIPADCSLIEESNVMVDESLLTGESAGVAKSVSGKAKYIYMGTIVLTGKCIARVMSTGMKTEMGKIAGMLKDIESEKSPLKEKLARLGTILVVICIAICIIVTLLGIMRGENVYEMFLLGVSLAVAAIPEGLPAIVTVALALGVSRMLKRNALVRKLPAVETLGCTSIICSDKTGTLTQNKMTLKEIYANGKSYNKEDEFKRLSLLKKCFSYCSDCSFEFGDPTETALIKAFFKNNDEFMHYKNSSKKLFEIPFSSERKMMTVAVRENLKTVIYTKGAPERLIEKCTYYYENSEVKPLTPYKKKEVLNAIENMSQKALRCIGGAYKEETSVNKNGAEAELTFLGIAGIIDPPRLEVKDSVLKCRLAGIRPVMITGDHKNTAFAIANELNICSSIDQVISGSELDSISDDKLAKIIDKISVYARVNPNHKYRIVKAFKKRKFVVAMTGDGVNDAPAVKEADIGISMGISGTDVTKEASSMILLDDNFSTIVAAVEEGRVIYNNIRKFIRYLLSCNLGEVLTMFLASIFNLANPLLPIQILFVNLATDGLPALALGVDPPEGDIMKEKVRHRNESIFADGLSEKILIRGTLIGVCTILSFIIGKYYGFDLKTCRTIALSTLIMSQLIHVFECRSEKHSIFEIDFFANKYLVLAVLGSIIMLVCVLYIPFFSIVFHTESLNLFQWAIVIFFSGIIAFINSLYLYAFNNRRKK